MRNTKSKLLSFHAYFTFDDSNFAFITPGQYNILKTTENDVMKFKTYLEVFISPVGGSTIFRERFLLRLSLFMGKVI